MKKILIGTLFILHSLQALALDNFYAISRSNFNIENFLDINSVQFDDAMQEQWHQFENGWRMTGHSLTADLLYSHIDVKLKNELSQPVNVYLRYQQQDFYYDKPLSSAEFELEVRPFNTAIGFSVISTVDYQKALADIGFAITLGQRSGDFLQFKNIAIDPLFNQKRSGPELDQASYSDTQHKISIEAAYQWSPSLKTHFLISDLSPMLFNFNDQISTFSHQGYQYDASVRYQHNNDHYWRLRFNGFKDDKSLTSTGSQQQQQISYHSVNLQWLFHQTRPYQYSLGLRDDRFSNDIRDALMNSNNLDYRFSTTQIYSTMQHFYQPETAWNLGIYIGLVHEPFDENETDTAVFARQYQSQLRVSWLYLAKNKKSRFKIHGSLNLDDIIDDPGDGLGLTWQSVF
ncbi:MAG: hypothetical protein OEY29_00905 [Gammaproteobacteria bacterium]|nr:hypothetical protein [Gammaproteobacteria bacterium]